MKDADVKKYEAEVVGLPHIHHDVSIIKGLHFLVGNSLIFIFARGFECSPVYFVLAWILGPSLLFVVRCFAWVVSAFGIHVGDLATDCFYVFFLGLV